MSATTGLSATTALSTATVPGPTGVVVGVDGSEPSLSALRWGAFIASVTDTTLLVVSTWQTTPSFGLISEGSGGLASDIDPDAVLREALDTAVSRALGGSPPVGLECRVLRGNTTEVLLELSADARMLVVGSRGHGGFTGLLLGSVSAACTEHATCPVLVI
ncbi:MAG: universal stress protein, partial [Lapillicoccus sp.]